MKIFFSDIDGTLINDDHQVTPKTKDAIRQKLAQDNLFVPVSARMPEAIMTVADTISDHYPMIAYNGALILDQNGKEIFSKTMSAVDAEEIVGVVEAKYPDLAWNAYSDHDWYSPKMEANLNEEKIVQVESTKAHASDLADKKEFHKLLIIGDPDELASLQVSMKDQYPKLNFVKSSPILLEIFSKEVNKGEAVKFFIDYEKVDVNDTWGFGDNFNDQEMLKTVGHSVVMGNAPDELKQQADNITSDNNHDGIAEFLAKL